MAGSGVREVKAAVARGGRGWRIVDGVGRTDAGGRPSRVYVLLLRCPPFSCVIEVFTSRGSYVYFGYGWGCLLWYASLCVLTSSIEFLAQFSFVD